MKFWAFNIYHTFDKRKPWHVWQYFFFCFVCVQPLTIFPWKIDNLIYLCYHQTHRNLSLNYKNMIYIRSAGLKLHFNMLLWKDILGIININLKVQLILLWLFVVVLVSKNFTRIKNTKILFRIELLPFDSKSTDKRLKLSNYKEK